jgi:hypothetical protein
LFYRLSKQAIDHNAGLTVNVYWAKDSGHIKLPVCGGSTPQCYRLEIPHKPDEDVQAFINLPKMQSTLVAHIIIAAPDNRVRKTYAVKLRRGLDGERDWYLELSAKNCDFILFFFFLLTTFDNFIFFLLTKIGQGRETNIQPDCKKFNDCSDHGTCRLRITHDAVGKEDVDVSKFPIFEELN